MGGGGRRGTRYGGHRSRTRRQPLLTASLVCLAAALSLAVSETTPAPAGPSGSGVLELVPAVGAPSPAPESPLTAPPIEYPTISAPRQAVPGTGHVGESVALSARPADIPDVALAAYHRAATVINATDKTCHLSWSVIAAIGRVESDHGRHAGSSLDEDGVASPPIVGARLDGHGGTTRIRDTDAGELDGDTAFDRAVGPMQFIPSTWSYVGVDGDSDGRRNPQDIDDAALATAVYLCVGKGDLGTTADLRQAIYRYNHSNRYVDLVLAVAEAYDAGNGWVVSHVPLPSGGAGFTAVPVAGAPGGPPGEPTAEPVPQPTAEPVPQPTAEPVTPPPPAPTPATPIDPPDPGPSIPPIDPPDPEPSSPPIDPPDPGPSSPPVDPPVAEPPPGPDPQEPPATAPASPTDTALALCTELGFVDDPADPADPFDGCVAVAVAAAPGDAASPALTVEVLAELLAAAGIPVPLPPEG